VFGVKTPWGVDDASGDGERLDEHVQPGTAQRTGSPAFFASHQIDPKSAIFVSAQCRQTGRNGFGYRYGQVSLFNVAYDRKSNAPWDAVIEANYRHAGIDQGDANGSIEPDTGRLRRTPGPASDPN
jgi:hypothetical protein